MLMEILNSTLTHNLRNNPHLIYTMLYKRDLFDTFQNHPMFQDLIWNIGAVRKTTILRSLIVRRRNDFVFVLDSEPFRRARERFG